MRDPLFLTRLLNEFSLARRRVVSDWRILIVARRLAGADRVPLPSEKAAGELRKELVRRRELVPVQDVPGVFVADVPYANLLEVSEEQIIQEANPWAAFSHLTAMALHGLTDIVPREIHALALALPAAVHSGRIPLGTTPEDWLDDVPYPVARRPPLVRGIPVHWAKPAKDSAFGITIAYSFGVPIYATDVERTLLDALRSPEKAGGIAKVIEAWTDVGNLDLDKLIKCTENYQNQVLRQRVGYLLEALGGLGSDPRIESWRRGLQRGGSVRLVANRPYSEVHSRRWNLSLNVPPSVLGMIEKG